MAEHLQLARREPTIFVRGRGAATEPPLDRGAEPGDLRGRQAASGAAPSRRATRCASASRSSAASRWPAAASATPARSRMWARSNGISRFACSSTARPSCSAAASGWPSASAVSPRAWASAASASGWPVRAAMPDSASAHARASASRPSPARKHAAPAQAPDRVVMVLAARPAVEQEAAVLARAVELARARLQPGQRGGAVDGHRGVEPRRGRERADEQRPRRGVGAPERVDRAEHAVGHDQLGVDRDDFTGGPQAAPPARPHDPIRPARAARTRGSRCRCTGALPRRSPRRSRPRRRAPSRAPP